ncbi:ABC transporter substrate-binding protein [Aeromicrobium sp. CTD01-1L150]|uniref:ABC transporter substrate-binding protein n=1 Tax=Aeromicrobium sp. CTD01-1L150 TaxID=3341830 RepID=UPI0035C263F1
MNFSASSAKVSAATGAIAALALAACGGGGQSGGDITVALSTPAMAPNWVALAVAEENGYFADEGLDVDAQFLETSGDLLQAMEGGRVDIGAPTPETILPAVEQGQEITMVYRWTRQPTAAYAVAEDSEIREVADLEGARIGVQSRSAGPAMLSNAALTQVGLEPESDVEYVEVSAGAAAMDALNRERVDALMLYDTQYAAMEQLGTTLRQIRPDGVDNLFSTTFVSTNERLEEDPDAVAGFGRAWTQGQVWALAHPEKAMEIMWERYPDSRTGTGDEDQQMQSALAVFDARMEIVDVGDPSGSGTWGEYDPAQIDEWIEFATDNELIEERLDIDSLYTNEFVDYYNDIDLEELRGKG